MKTLKIKKRYSEKKDEHTLEVRGEGFLYVLLSDSKDIGARADMIQEVINYYEFGKIDEELELIERIKTPKHIFYTILSKNSKNKDNLRSIQLNKENNKHNCSCDHGALHSVNNNQICKHIKYCIKIEDLYKLHNIKE